MTTSSTTAASATSTTTVETTAPVQAPAGQGTPITPVATGDATAAKAKSAKQAKALNLDEATIASLGTIETSLQAIRAKSTSKPDRARAISALTKSVLSLGLGARSGGHGPFVRAALSQILLDVLGDEAVKVLKKDKISVDLIVRACRRKSISSDGIRALKAIEQKLAENDVKSEAKNGRAVSVETLASRKSNLAAARAWFDHSGPRFYALGWTGLKSLGVSRVVYGGGTLFLDRAAGLALGRSVTAAELVADEALTVG